MPSSNRPAAVPQSAAAGKSQFPANCCLIPCYVTANPSSSPSPWNVVPILPFGTSKQIPNPSSSPSPWKVVPILPFGTRKEIVCEEATSSAAVKPSVDFENRLTSRPDGCSSPSSSGEPGEQCGCSPAGAMLSPVSAENGGLGFVTEEPQDDERPAARPPLVELQLFPTTPSSPVLVKKNSAPRRAGDSGDWSRFATGLNSKDAQTDWRGIVMQLASAYPVEDGEAWGKLVEMRESYSAKDEEEDRAKGVCTKLKLYEDPWTIRKKLRSIEVRTESAACTLLIDSETLRNQIVPLLTKDEMDELRNDRPVEVGFWDVDTESLHDMALVRRHVKFRSKLREAIGFGGNWSRGFVRRRRLEEGDEVGLCWDPQRRRFNFRVIARYLP